MTGLRPVLGAAAVADSANGVFVVAALLAAARFGGSPAAVALVSASSSLPWLLVAVPAGVLADSVDRRLLIGAGNACRGLLMLALGGLVGGGVLSGPGLVTVLAVVVFAVGSVQTVVDTAAESLVPDLVPDPAGLTRANGYLAVSTRLCYQTVGPFGAGVLFGWSPRVPLLVAGAGCLVAVVVLVGRSGRAPSRARRSRRAALRTGIVIILRSPVLATTVLVGAVTSVMYGAFMAVFVGYAVRPGPLGLSEAAFGAVVAAAGLGGAAGAVATAWFERLAGTGTTLVLTRVGWAAVYGAPAVVGGLVMAAVFVAGSFFGAMWAVLAMSIRQRAVAAHLRGQVAGAARMITWGASPVGALLGGVVGGLAGPRAVFAMAAVGTLATIVPVRRWLGSDGRQ